MSDEERNEAAEESTEEEKTEEEETDTDKSADDTPVADDTGDKGLGTESGAAGGGESPPNNPDPSTKGATKGTEGAL